MREHPKTAAKKATSNESWVKFVICLFYETNSFAQDLEREIKDLALVKQIGGLSVPGQALDSISLKRVP